MTIDKFPAISLTCINTDLETVCGEIVEILNNSSPNKCTIETEQMEDIAYTNLFELQYNPDTLKILLWQPKLRPDTTIFISNFADGSDSLINILSYNFGHETYKIFMTMDSRPKYKVFLFNWRKSGRQRAVSVSFEDKWIFFQTGDPLPMEKDALSNYKKRRISDRLNKRIVLDILKNAGWDIENDFFWQSASPRKKISLRYRV